MMKTSFIPFILFALMIEPVRSCASTDEAATAYEQSDYTKAEALINDAGLKDKESRLLLCMTCRESYALYKNREHRDKARYLFDILKTELTTDDLEMLLKYSSIKAKPEGNKVAIELMDKLLDKPLTPAQCKIIGDFLYDERTSPEGRMVMMRAIRTFVQNARNYVNRGGRIPPDVVEILGSESFIQSVVKGIEDKKTTGLAVDILKAVEQPALVVLEGMQPTPAVLKAISQIKNAEANRLKKYPQSSWDSAYAD